MNLDIEPIKIMSRSGNSISGWLSEIPYSNGIILLLHGVRGNRLSMIERARFFRKHDYTTLSIDLQAHGESDGDKITFGHLEAQDTESAIAYLKEKYPQEPITVLGTSLGGASALLANFDTAPNAIIAEAVYSDITQATKNRLRMRFGPLGEVAAPLLTVQMNSMIGVSANELSPIEALKTNTIPILLIYGTEDKHTTIEEGRAMHEAANEPKELLVIDGAAHVNFHQYNTAVYERKVINFLEKYGKR